MSAYPNEGALDYFGGRFYRQPNRAHLVRGAAARDGRVPGEAVVGQGKIPDQQAKAIGVTLEKSHQVRLEPPRMGRFEVDELDDRDRRSTGSPNQCIAIRDVEPRGQGRLEVDRDARFIFC